MLKNQVLTPSNSKIARGKACIVSIIIIYALLELFSIYHRLTFITLSDLVNLGIRNTLAIVLFKKLYSGNRTAEVFSILLFITGTIYTFTIYNQYELFIGYVKWSLLFIIVYYALSVLLLTFSPAVRAFMAVQRIESNLAIIKKIKLDTEIQWVWSWSGIFIGYIKHNYLWSYTGKNIGQVSGADIYDTNGRYIGELYYNRLITNKSKRNNYKNNYENNYQCVDQMPSYPKAPDIDGYIILPKYCNLYEDFSGAHV